jgi:excisionase family DNA binding protein
MVGTTVRSRIWQRRGVGVIECPLGVHEETIRRWAREVAIPAAKLGNRGGFRFKREDLAGSLSEWLLIAHVLSCELKASD